MPLSRFPRLTLAHLPTPLEPLERLGDHLAGQPGGGPRLYVKRDDCTGLASGGNKTRKLEFLLAEALEQGCDTIVTEGGRQSNHVRQTAAAAVPQTAITKSMAGASAPPNSPQFLLRKWLVGQPRASIWAWAYGLTRPAG